MRSDSPLANVSCRHTSPSIHTDLHIQILEHSDTTQKLNNNAIQIESQK
jgi:hypothetical protein